MTLNPFLGMNREQLDHTRVILQLAAALGSFDEAFEALDRCIGDEQVDIKLWELSTEKLDELAHTAERIQSSGGGEEIQQALRRHSAQKRELADGQGRRDSTPPTSDLDRARDCPPK